MGKTHLLNAIGLKLKSSKKVMFISWKGLCTILLNP